jgi:pyocin large subunit-like protein
LNDELKTVGDYIRRLQEFPEDWPVKVATQAGGGMAIEHREIKGKPVVAVFGSNGGRFGENPLTDQEYAEKSKEFLQMWKNPYYSYTSCHGDHRMYHPYGQGDACYGHHFDRRVIERMVEEGLIPADRVDIDRVRRFD